MRDSHAAGAIFRGRITAVGDSASSVERAAELLQAAFRANGIDLEAKRESEAKAGLPAFYLGASKLAAANGIDPKALSRLS